MYYVYVLYFDEIPIYAGMTNCPITRYKAHFFDWDSNVRNFSRHHAVVNNKFITMKCVYCSEDKTAVCEMEDKAISALSMAGFNIFNKNIATWCNWKRQSFEITIDPPLPVFPHIKRLPQKLFTFERIKHVIDSKNEILKEYGHETHRHYNMDHSKSISRRIGNRRAKRSQLGSKT